MPRVAAVRNNKTLISLEYLILCGGPNTAPIRAPPRKNVISYIRALQGPLGGPRLGADSYLEPVTDLSLPFRSAFSGVFVVDSQPRQRRFEALLNSCSGRNPMA